MRTIALAASLLTAAATAHADARPAIGGFVDGNIVWDTAGSQSGTVAGLTTPVRQGASVNLVLLDASVESARFRARVELGDGAALDALHGGSAWKYLVEANAAAALGHGLSVEAGLFPSHLGFEGFASRDNWSYSHGWLGEAMPRYQAGARLDWAVTPKLSTQIAWLSGWDVVERDHRFSSVGAQAAWTSGRLSAAVNLYGGPRPGRSDGARLFADLWVELAATPWLAFAAAFDGGVDTATTDGAVTRPGEGWYGGAVYARLLPVRFIAFTVRADLLDDTDGGERTGAAQRLSSLTFTVDHLLGAVTVRLEARIDHASAPTLDGNDTRGLVVAALNGRF